MIRFPITYFKYHIHYTEFSVIFLHQIYMTFIFRAYFLHCMHTYPVLMLDSISLNYWHFTSLNRCKIVITEAYDPIHDQRFDFTRL